MQVIKMILVFSVAWTLGGCASLTFYPDPAMKKDEVGLKFHYAKPYILVARDGTFKVTSVSIVYLPDLENPVYARARSGYGSANLTLAFANGIITNFGQQTNTEVPAGLTSLGSLDVAMANARKVRVEAANLENQSGDFGKYSEPLKAIAVDIRSVIAEDKTNVLTQHQRVILITNANLLDGGGDPKKGGLATAFAEPGAAANADKLVSTLEEISKAIGFFKPASDQLSEEAKKVWSKLKGLQVNLNKISDDLKPQQLDPADLSLYEIIMVNGTTSLKEVPLGASAK